MEAEDLRVRLQSLEIRFNNKGISNGRVQKTPLSERIQNTKVALDLARGDVRRYGAILEDTTRYLRSKIFGLALGGNFHPAYYFVDEYAELEKQIEFD